MTQFTCKGVKQINNQISLNMTFTFTIRISAFFVSAGVPNEEFPEILIAKCRSRFYCTWFFSRAEDFESWREGRRDPQNRENIFLLGGEIVQEINVSSAGDPVHAGDKALTQETLAQRGRVNRYARRRHIVRVSPRIQEVVLVNERLLGHQYIFFSRYF